MAWESEADYARAAMRACAAGSAFILAGLVLAGGCDQRPADGPAGVLRVFGGTGLGPGEFSYPRAAALGPDGRLYVIDKAARVQVFDADGAFVRAWRMPAWDAGKPTGLTVDARSRVFVADTHYFRVIVYDSEGRESARFGSQGEGPGQFILPTDVAVDAEGCIFVAEYSGNDRISKFTPTFEYMFSFGGRDSGTARLQRPQSLLVDGDVLWVADACNHRICRFGLDGTFRGAFGRSGSARGELRFPYGIDRLPDGTLIVAEFGNNRIQRFDREGRSLGTWGAAGRGPGQLAYPWAVQADDAGRIFVIDSGNNRVQVLDSARVDWQ